MTRAVVWDTTGLKGLCAHHHNSKKYDSSMLAFVRAVTEMAHFPCGHSFENTTVWLPGQTKELPAFLTSCRVYIYTQLQKHCA